MTHTFWWYIRLLSASIAFTTRLEQLRHNKIEEYPVIANAVMGRLVPSVALIKAQSVVTPNVN